MVWRCPILFLQYGKLFVPGQFIKRPPFFQSCINASSVIIHVINKTSIYMCACLQRTHAFALSRHFPPPSDSQCGHNTSSRLQLLQVPYLHISTSKWKKVLILLSRGSFGPPGRLWILRGSPFVLSISCWVSRQAICLADACGEWRYLLPGHLTLGV